MRSCSQLDRKKCQVANSLLIQGSRLGYIERPLALGNYGPTDKKKGQVWNSRNLLCDRGNSILLPVSHSQTLAGRGSLVNREEESGEQPT